MSKIPFLTRLTLLTAVLALATTAAADGTVRPAPPNEHGQYRYLIEFAEPGLLERQVGRVSDERFRNDAPGVQAARERLMARHAEYLERMTAEAGRALEVTHYFLVTHSGMAVWLHPGEAEIVARIPGVVSVERELLYELATFRGPTFIGADQIWDGSATPDGKGTRGEGMVAAVLDTGVDPDHPSFANDASCGHGSNGTPDKLLSLVDCATTDGSGMCNGPLPFDTNSHGTHVASTVAGNRLDASADPPPEPFEEISGVAPCAHIRSYKVCPDISCPAALIQAGMDSVLLDGDVHVMNFSITGGRNPWNDNDRRKLDLVGAGVFVAAAAGNTGVADDDTEGLVNHLGPWVFSVAASTHDGGDVDLPVLSASGPGDPPSNTQLLVMIKGSAEVGEVPDGEPFTDKPIRRFIDPLGDEFEGCAPFPPDFFAGAVALIKRGTCTFAQKILNAELAGAEMVVIRNDEPGALPAWNAGAPTVPAYSLSLADGEAMADWIGQHPDDATADFDFVPGQGIGDVLAGFSLRGPTPAPLQDLTKPDITAPGVSIFAAEPGLLGFPGGYGFKSGTSMATPHAAGAAALVRAVRPGWTVSEVRSAMMMTAFKGGTKEDTTTSWDWDDVGSGRVDLAKATLAGLVMDETFDNYLAANPATGGDVKTLNLPAVRNMDCTPSCSWTRTVRNSLEEPASWTASGVSITPGFAITIAPASFELGGGTGETQELTITAIPLTDLTAEVAFGEVVLSEAGGLSPDLHLTVAIQGVGEPAPVAVVSPESFDFELPQGGSDSDTLEIANLGNVDLVWSIDEAESAGACDSPVEIPWLAVSPDAGITAPDGSEPADVLVDSTGLSEGTFEAALCVITNDPNAPLVPVPVTLTVTGDEGGLTPVALEVDFAPLASDGNDVLEPGELVEVAPAWRNDGSTPHDLQGTASSFTGPKGADYTLVHDDANYGRVDPGQAASCRETEVCYQLEVSDPAVRPATHWDGTFEETLSEGTTKTWTLHIGDSFVDVSRTSPFYRFVETILHRQITGGCRDTEYCPTAETTRGQMPVFVLRALEGADFLPPACVEGEEVFADVPATSAFCPWIQELFEREVTAGCGEGNYCPNDAVNRQQMAVFLLRTVAGPDFTPPACSGIFADVPCPSTFADWVEELFHRGVTGGCGTDPDVYCPTDPVNRQQMAVFVSTTFGLFLYGP